MPGKKFENPLIYAVLSTTINDTNFFMNIKLRGHHDVHETHNVNNSYSVPSRSHPTHHSSMWVTTAQVITEPYCATNIKNQNMSYLKCINEMQKELLCVLLPLCREKWMTFANQRFKHMW
jgi:hypothetical protein